LLEQLTKMEIIDSHHHLWDTRQLHYTLFDTIPGLNRPFLPAQYEEETIPLGVTASVCVEAASAGADGLAETEWLLGQARANPKIAGVVIWAPLERPDLAAYLNKVTSLDQAQHVVGVRRSFEFEPPDFASRPDVIAGVKSLAQYGYTVDLVLFHPAMPAMLELVERCPEIDFVLDHLGKPAIRSRGWQPWASHLERLASFDNVVCKLSGLSTEADHKGWQQADLQAYMEHAVACFGWKRLLFGSDWPVCNLAGGYARWMDTLRNFLADVPQADQACFWAENARRVYRLPARASDQSLSPQYT
jgi:L-fuconolactonase